MAMKRCPQGHYFDPGKHTSCPVCGVQGLEIGVTAPRRGVGRMSPPRSEQGADSAATQPMGGAQGGGKAAQELAETRVLGQTPPPPPEAETGPGPQARISAMNTPTRKVMHKDLDMDPVVGWLVCTKGPERGQDYSLRSERNFIGRGGTMDVAIQGDDAVSRERHAIVSFNPKTNTFRLVPGEAKGLVYLNGAEVSQPMDLMARDEIELGKTTLLFVPLCGEDFQWGPLNRAEPARETKAAPEPDKDVEAAPEPAENEDAARDWADDAAEPGEGPAA